MSNETFDFSQDGVWQLVKARRFQRPSGSVCGGVVGLRRWPRAVSLLPGRYFRLNVMGLVAGGGVVGSEVHFLAEFRKRCRQISLQLEDHAEGEVIMVRVRADDDGALHIGGGGVDVMLLQFREAKVEEAVGTTGVDLGGAAEEMVGVREFASHIIGISKIIINIPIILLGGPDLLVNL